jgi:hypothetical protein
MLKNYIKDADSRDKDKHHYKETIESQINKISINMDILIGIKHQFKTNYLFRQKLELGFEYRVVIGISPTMVSSFCGPEARLISMSWAITNKLYSF